jgi:hypothetical protein
VFLLESARQEPAQVREAVQIGHDARFVAESQANGVPLGTPDDGAGEIQGRARPILARHDELGWGDT